MTAKPFAPWRNDFTSGSALLLAGVLAFALIWQMQASLFRYGPFALLVVLFGFWRVQRGYHRWHGKYVEGRALEALGRRLPDDWKIACNVMTSFGDCDAVITTPTTRFVVEIKSVSGVKLQRRLFRGTSLAFSKGQNANPGSHLAQAARLGGHAGGVPILWYPRAGRKDFGQMDDIWVVTGSAAMVVRAIQKHLARNG